MLSFIVPAHDEERWIGKCLGSIRATMQKIAEPYEVIVVDDASTDSTRQIAQQFGVRTLQVAHRKISAVRNARVLALGEFAGKSTSLAFRAAVAQHLSVRPRKPVCVPNP